MKNLTKKVEKIETDAIALAASNSDIVDCMVHLCIERHSHLLANCLDATNGNITSAITLFEQAQLAYKVSGFGEYIIISFLRREIPHCTMWFFLGLASDPKIAQLRKERKLSQKGSPFFPARKLKRANRNIFGRSIGGRLNRRRRK